jgi:hypothetical protein
MPFPMRILAYVWLAVFCLLTVISVEHLITPVTPGWDIAADMLLQNRIRNEGLLLTGHYSRWEFNHPGPFWFYYNHVIEWLLSPFELSRVQVWHCGALLLSSLLVAYAATGLSVLLQPLNRLTFALACAALLVAFIGPELIGIWMPERLIAPYAAFMVSVALLSRGNINTLPITVLLVCILVHGYVTMPILTLPFLAWAGWMGWRHQRNWHCIKLYTGSLIVSSLIILLFVAPLVIDFVLQDISNIERILGAQASFKHHEKPDTEDVFTFIGQLLWRNRSWQWAGVAVLLVFLWRAPRQVWRMQSVRYWLKLLLVASLFIFFYYSRTPAPLFAFIAKFYLAVPPLVLAVLLLYKKQKTWLTTSVILFMLAPYFKLASIEQGTSLRTAAQAMAMNAANTPILLDYDDHYQWPLVAGLLLELNRRGVSACTTWEHMAFLYTKSQVCQPDQRATHRLIKPDACTDNCLYVAKAFAIQPIKLANITPGMLIHTDSTAVSFNDWQSPEHNFRWTRDTESEILFRAAKAPFKGRLTLVLDTLDKQTLTLSLNGKVLYSAQLEARHETLTIPFDPRLLQPNEVNVLTLQTPDARAPTGPDARILAVALRSLTFE